MYSAEVHHLVFKEKSKDLQRAAARHQLIRSIQGRQSENGNMLRRITGRIGTQMIKWGSKLQRIEQSHQQTLPQQGL